MIGFQCFLQNTAWHDALMQDFGCVPLALAVTKLILEDGVMEVVPTGCNMVPPVLTKNR